MDHLKKAKLLDASASQKWADGFRHAGEMLTAQAQTHALIDIAESLRRITGGGSSD